MKNIHILQENIYITSDEEIKEGDYYITPNNSILKSLGQMLTNVEDYKKIILTTDQDLIKDDVQTIDDDFLEWFVKNPSCEEVETERLEDGKYVDRFADGSVVEGVYENYKIIIPKKEPKQSAVEWLIDELLDGKILMPTLINQANEMFKQQIIEAHFQGVKETVLNVSEHINIPKTLNTIQEIENGTGKHEEGEDYYNEKFNK
jgi:hypothetical protein